jgi:hypothetical protein
MLNPEMHPQQPSWIHRIAELKAFIARHGHGNVTPQTEGYQQLGSWVSATRHKAKYGKLNEQEIAELSKAGFLWNINEQRKSGSFDRWLDVLRKYAAKHGHCKVTPKTPGYEALGTWVSSQRVRHNKGLMYDNHFKALDSVGFVWDLQGQRKISTFDEWAAELKSFLKKNGHSNAGPRTAGHEALGTWVIAQRTRRKKGLLSEREIQVLDELEFIWDFQAAKSQQTWIKKYHELEAYYMEHGHSDMPRTHENKTLANWVWIQRQRNKGGYRKAGPLTPAQISLLNKLAFKWDLHEDNWAESFLELKTYGAKHGGKFDPIDDKVLSRWASSQRRAYHRGELNEERISQLNGISFTWESAATENLWQECYAELMAYHRTHGNANPPRLSMPKLGGWCAHQRQARKAGKMPEHRIKLLDELGFVWLHHEKTPWDVHFEALREYIKIKGDSYVPHRYAENPKLGFFVRNIRVQHAADKLTHEQITKLESIGFQWGPSGRRGRRREA